MNQFEFEEILSSVEAQFGRFDDDLRNYLQGRYRSLSPDIWRRICDWIIDHCGVRPKANKFLEAKQKVAPSYYSAQKKEESNCAACNGVGFDVSYFVVEPTQMPYSGVSSCLSCNSGQYVPKTHVRISRYVTESEYREMMKSSPVGSSGSEKAIVVGDGGADSDIEAWIPLEGEGDDE